MTRRSTILHACLAATVLLLCGTSLLSPAHAADPVRAVRQSFFQPASVPSLGKLTLSAKQKITIDTGNAETDPSISGDASFKGVRGLSASGKVELAVFNFDEIHLPQGVEVTITGNRGLVLMSKGSIVLDTTLDVSGTSAKDGQKATSDPEAIGAAGGPGAEGGERGKSLQSAPPPDNRGNGSPGLKDKGRPGTGFGAGFNQRAKGGTAGGGGGYGGKGGNASEGSKIMGGPIKAMEGGEAYGDAPLTDLFGGSGGAGGSNDRAFTSGGGGGGGGAIALIALGAIELGGEGKLLARGGNGAEYKTCGGGGSGGAILLAAPAIKLDDNSALDVRGGNGGQVEGVAAEIAAGGSRRQLGNGGGGSGGRVAIYSSVDFARPGKNRVETADLPAQIKLDGGSVGEAAEAGAAGSFHDGTWPGLR